ncbi:MAG: hypothetical protein AB1508_18990 [Pseudomonadota bacterium]
MKVHRHLMRLALTIACAYLLAGCASQGRSDKDPLIVAEQLRAAGFKGRIIIMFGGGHIGGVSYNVTGSSGLIEATIEPIQPDKVPP